MEFKVISFYKYVEVSYPDTLRDEIRNICEELSILGRILIGNEGINACISGNEENIEKFKNIIKSNSLFSDLTFKEEKYEDFTHHKLVVRFRKEIVKFGMEVSFSNPGKYIEAEELKELFDKNEDFIIIDARNDYEFKVGKFKNAITLPIETFREFPEAVKNLDNLKNKKIITYCTGGIRCEKASAYMKEIGFNDVYQLQGGIINFIDKFPGKYFEGSCFVFDDRLTTNLGKIGVISECNICNNKCDEYINCHNMDCDKLFISCKNCQEELNKSCSEECKCAKRRRREKKNFEIIGHVENYFAKSKVAEVKLVGNINKKMKVNFIGKTTNFEQEIKELRDFSGNSIDNSKEEQIVTLPVIDRVRKNDKIILYK